VVGSHCAMRVNREGFGGRCSVKAEGRMDNAGKQLSGRNGNTGKVRLVTATLRMERANLMVDSNVDWATWKVQPWQERSRRACCG
jgi:hypothetical protein